MTATKLEMLAEKQRQSDYLNAIIAAQQRQALDQQEAFQSGLENNYIPWQMMGFAGGGMAYVGLNQEELIRRYAEAVGAEKIFKNQAKPKATEEEMRGILSMITAADLIINFMNSGFTDFRGWLNAYINTNLESYRERQATKTDVGEVDPVTEDTPRAIISGS